MLPAMSHWVNNQSQRHLSLGESGLNHGSDHFSVEVKRLAILFVHLEQVVIIRQILTVMICCPGQGFSFKNINRFWSNLFHLSKEMPNIPNSVQDASGGHVGLLRNAAPGRAPPDEEWMRNPRR